MGATSYSILKQDACNQAQLIAIDSSKAMIQSFNQSLHQQGYASQVQLHHANIQDFPLKNASVVILNYVLQFIPPPQRDALLQKIWRSLVPGGVLLLSEKLRFDDSDKEQKMRTWHHDFKAASGYTPLEIKQKARDIKSVMQTDSLSQLNTRIQQAGYQEHSIWMQCYNFFSFVIEK